MQGSFKQKQKKKRKVHKLRSMRPITSQFQNEIQTCANKTKQKEIDKKIQYFVIQYNDKFISNLFVGCWFLTKNSTELHGEEKIPPPKVLGSWYIMCEQSQ